MPNHLAKEHSPYLQAHTNNPVEWYPWGETAFALAKQTGKPILLSIGYSACHWCHVMAYESFEDPDIANLMNDLFINIKVDCEERPDLDKVYQLAHQLITQRSGGWPLTVFLTPDEHMPFFAGTYFPKTAQKNSNSFEQVLKYIAQIYQEKRPEIQSLTEELKTAFSQLSHTEQNPSVILTDAPLTTALEQLAEDFDEENGGFGEAPKFPHPLQCDFLLDFYETHHHEAAKILFEKTLDAMALGGIYDQLGGGFFRYSTDPNWEIPHFEKMLYDSALLINTYCKGYQLTQKPLYRRIIRETADWLIEVMQAESGGFYATLNADSNGQEGGYYLWEPEQCKAALSDKQYVAFKNYVNLDEAPNMECKWHFYVKNESTFSDVIAQAKETLLADRNKRIPPSCDTKILCGWNALAIKGLLQAAICLEEPRYSAQADKALQFLQTQLFKDDKLFAAYKDNTAYLTAYLDDYAFLLDAVLDRYQQNKHPDLLAFANTLAAHLQTHFYDHDQGAFFFTADYHEQIIHRPKVLLDDATPAGNSIAAKAFHRLYELTGELDYQTIAMNTVKTCWEYVNAYPAAHCSLLTVLKRLV